MQHRSGREKPTRRTASFTSTDSSVTDHGGDSLLVRSASADHHHQLNAHHHGSLANGDESLIVSSSTTNAAASRIIPGRPRRKHAASSGIRKSGRKSKFCRRCYGRWCKGMFTSCSTLILAVSLWYSLGVISIGTSKLLLINQRGQLFGGVPPLFLTLQQLVIGSSLLRFLIQIRCMGLSTGLQPWPSASSLTSHSIFSNRMAYGGMASPSSVRIRPPLGWTQFPYHPTLVLSGAFFSLGFLATNFGFSGASAAFVETIKAAEPITSATIAVWWGIETLSPPEGWSLLTIVAGVLLSTLGNSGSERDHLDDLHVMEEKVATPLLESLRACLIVMAANLCFSFRGLYQKLFRSTTEGNAQIVDDLNLQFRMQQVGVVLMVVPVLMWDTPTLVRYGWRLMVLEQGWWRQGLLLRYAGLALINGFAFTSYNLASTYILTRISVVHHAALNCIRRIFAIIVTSVAFAVPITLTGALGILVSFCGFMSFTHYKVKRHQQPKPVSSLLPVSAAVN